MSGAHKSFLCLGAAYFALGMWGSDVWFLFCAVVWGWVAFTMAGGLK